MCDVTEDGATPNVRHYKDYRSNDVERLFRDVNGQVCYFNNLVLSLFEQYVPWRRCRDRNVSEKCVWFSYKIDRAIVERDIAHCTKSYQKKAANKLRFIMLSKKTRNLVRRAKREYTHRLLDPKLPSKVL
jgi:hypothetical protein